MHSAKKGPYPLILLTAGHFLSDFYANFLPALLPVVLAKLSLSLTAGGFLVMIFSVTACVLQPICGYYIDRRSFAWLILVTLPASAATICFSPLAPSYLLLIICVALSGLASSVFHPLASSLINKITPPANKGLAMSVFIGGGNVGFGLAPAVVIYILFHYGPEYLAWLIAPAVMLTFAYHRFRLHRVDLQSSAQVSAGNVVWYKSSSLLKLNAVMALRSWAQTALPTFLPVLLVQQGQPPTLAGAMLTVYLLSGALGGFIGGSIGDRIGRKRCVAGCLAVALPAMFLFIRGSEINPTAWVMLALCGGALQGTLPSSVVWAQEMIPGNAAMASGMMMGLSFGLGGVGIALTGALADHIGLQPALLWTLAPLAAAIPLTFLIPEKRSGSAPPTIAKTR